jgi:transcriptional regulator with XRE-family HTH domain
MENLRCISARLKRTREALGFSQARWCRLVGITPSAWNNYERGANRISLDQALKICRATGISLDWIYRGLRAGMPYELACKLLKADKA